MPFYTIHHTSLFNGFEKRQIATRLTDAHNQITGAPRTDVNVAFIDISEGDFFSGGERCDEWVRVVVQLDPDNSQSLSPEQKRALRSQMTSACRALLYASCEVQAEVFDGISRDFTSTEEIIDEGAELKRYQTDFHHEHFPVDNYSLVIGEVDTVTQRTDLLLPDYERGAGRHEERSQTEFEPNNLIGWTVEPILASDLYASVQEASHQHAHQRLPTGSKNIDDMLDGGLNYGECGITCLSIADDCSGRDLVLAFLAHHITSSPAATATIIDTAFSLDVRALYEKIVEVLRSADTLSVEVETKAMEVLDRVRITKVFDFIGLTEAFGELRSELEASESLPGDLAAAQTPPRGTIADSQDDEELLETDSQGDVLVASPTTSHPQLVTTPQKSAHARSYGPHLLLVDDIATPAVPLVKANAFEGQALVTSFMRALAHLTRAHSMCSIVINGTASLLPRNRGTEVSPTIFASCLLRPALGVTLQWIVDLHLMVHLAPQAAKDTMMMSEISTGIARNQQVQTANVVEVLYDRLGSRFQKWAAYRVDEAGCIQAVS
ncbi:hypothetical protein K431DRAFT_346485 [Polychaeton citri CBS 116435]|uniref:Tautomerase cis-CaaD-like domain-containing protein n=1 Tax=Polychaeton citri CBS 116435 TaxID=1314669 RepID=A0A9P4Q7G1_9PEZI|nr:hypothetical protein K431DRAFT_346485 [Polychaeton citri CBS 116435]